MSPRTKLDSATEGKVVAALDAIRAEHGDAAIAVVRRYLNTIKERQKVESEIALLEERLADLKKREP